MTGLDQLADDFSKFVQLKKRLAVLYNLPEGKVSICFDGSTLKDTVTLEDAGIEDEDLLDVKVSSITLCANVNICSVEP